MLTLFFTVALVHIVALMSPGPDFFLFLKLRLAVRAKKR
ncbi:threonine efflux system [Citrobacter youngae]|nr:putative membrane protein [Shigella flexneri 1235-66]VEI44050.1 threonine efflux system [Citrobacter youngae]